MAIQTENLGLYEKESSDYATDNFNIQSMLNDNWDKIDDAFGDLPSALTDMGLDEHGSVVDAVRKLADFGNWWFWEKWQWYPKGVNTTNVSPYTTYSGSDYKTKSLFGLYRYTGAWIEFYASDSYTLNDDGTIDLNNPTVVRITITGNTSYSGDVEALKGKYIRFNNRSSNDVHSYVTADADKVWYISPSDSFSVNYGTDPSSSNYNGFALLNTETVVRRRGYTSLEKIKSYASIGYVCNPEETKYPSVGKQGDYWYEIVHKVLPTMGLQKGDYIGTGVYDSYAITIPVIPRILFIINSSGRICGIYTADKDSGIKGGYYVSVTSSGSSGTYYNLGQSAASLTDSGIKIYVSIPSKSVLNTQGEKYLWYALI